MKIRQAAWSGLRAEFPSLVRLALPVIVAELGWMGMGVVDTVMVGQLGEVALGAIGIGSVGTFTIAVFGMGLFLGLDPLVSQAIGAGNREEARKWLKQAIWLALIIVVPLMGLVEVMLGWAIPAVGVRGEVLNHVAPYARAVNGSMLPLLVYAAGRRYLQSLGHARVVMFALVSANVINLIANWVFIHGKWGFPALGSTGAGVATTISRIYMAGVILWAIWASDGRALLRTGWGLDFARVGRIVQLGVPAALQITLEVGVFALMTTVAGTFNPTDLAAHQVALQIVSLAFMFPLGVGSASSVRVGHAVGRRDASGVAWAGWSGLVLATFIMGVISLVMVTVGAPLARGFTSQPDVIATAARLLIISACLQVFDAWQVVSTGNLRGVGNTRSPMLWNVLTHWGVGMPVGLGLGVSRGWSVVGLWFGLYAGLTLTGIILVITWARLTLRLKRDPASVHLLAERVQTHETAQPAHA